MATWHHADVAPSSVHQVTFVGGTDPSLDALNNVTAHKLWIDTTGSTFKIKKRNATNDGWDIVASLTHGDLTGMTTGDPHTQYLAKALGTVKGDVLVYDGAAWVALPAGSDGFLLNADSTAPQGIAWVSPSVLAAGHVIAAAGTALPQEGTLNFIGATVADDAANNRTNVTVFSSPMTTQDDLIVGGAAGAAARLAKGTDGQVLTVDPTTHHLVWATPTTGMANPMTTAGDIIVGGSAGAPGRLAKGADGQVLTVDPTTHNLVWATPAAPGTGTVTSVDFTATPTGIFDVSGVPIVGAGTIALSMDNQTTNKVLASPNGSTGQPSFRALVAADLPTITAAMLPTNTKRMSLAFQFGDGTNAIDSATEREQWLEINFDCTIEGYTLLADAAGSIVIDLWMDTYANYPPTVADSICASALPTLASAQKAQDVTLTGWTTTIPRGRILKAHVNSAGTVKAVTLTLDLIKT